MKTWVVILIILAIFLLFLFLGKLYFDWVVDLDVPDWLKFILLK